MKKLFITSLLTIFSFSTIVYGSDLRCSNSENEEVIQLELDNLEINGDGIFANHNGQWVYLRALVQDNNGRLLGTTSDWSFTWKCPKCDFENHSFRKSCGNCGYRP